MKTAVNMDEFDLVIKKIDQNNNLIQDNINGLKNKINELREIWQGEDSDKFINKANYYLDFLNSVPSILNDLNTTMKTTNSNYRKLDEEYAELLKKAVVKHE